MKHLVLSTLGLLLLAGNAFASAKVSYDNTTDPTHPVVTVTAHIYFYGPQASDTMAKAATDEINLYWNGGVHTDATVVPLKTYFGTKPAKFKFNVTAEVVSEADLPALQATATADMNFIKVLQGNSAAGDRSYMDDICANTGTWYLSDDLGNSTTAAHEFGHGLCLQHPATGDWRFQGQPPIMAPRGELVDAAFQYDPNAAAGAAGGTINPYKRRVTMFDVDAMKLSELSYATGIGYLHIGPHVHATCGRTD